MSKTWGIARLYGVGSMEYLLESEDWLADSKLFDGAPLLLLKPWKRPTLLQKRCVLAATPMAFSSSWTPRIGFSPGRARRQRACDGQTAATAQKGRAIHNL